ncbi:hypothetical protein ABTL79_19520, partial [Acinetobacter baumannii]
KKLITWGHKKILVGNISVHRHDYGDSFTSIQVRTPNCNSSNYVVIFNVGYTSKSLFKKKIRV